MIVAVFKKCVTVFSGCLTYVSHISLVLSLVVDRIFSLQASGTVRAMALEVLCCQCAAQNCSLNLRTLDGPFVGQQKFCNY